MIGRKTEALDRRLAELPGPQKVVALMAGLGIERQAVAKRAGTWPVAVSRALRPAMRPADREIVEAIADLANVPVDEIAVALNPEPAEASA